MKMILFITMKIQNTIYGEQHLKVQEDQDGVLEHQLEKIIMQ